MPRPKINKEVVRMSLEISPATRDRLDTLLVRTEADSRSGVIRRALQIYNELMAHYENGGQIVLTGLQGPEQRLILP